MSPGFHGRGAERFPGTCASSRPRYRPPSRPSPRRSGREGVSIDVRRSETPSPAPAGEGQGGGGARKGPRAGAACYDFAGTPAAGCATAAFFAAFFWTGPLVPSALRVAWLFWAAAALVAADFCGVLTGSRP